MRKLTSTIAVIAVAAASPAGAQESVIIAEETQEVAEAVEHGAEKLALAETALDLYWPEGNAQRAADYMLGPWADRMLDSPIRELAEPFQPVMKMFLSEMGGMMGDLEEMDHGEDHADESHSGETNPADDEASQAEMEEDVEASVDLLMALYGDMTVRQMIVGEDEHFDERFAIFRSVMGEELPALLTEFETPMRASLTQIFAERFSERELSAIAAFADTPAGQAFASNIFTVGFEPEYFAGVFNSFPGMMEKAPSLAEKLEARMAHLPPMFPQPEAAMVEDCEVNEEGEEVCTEVPTEEYEISADELDEWAAELEEQAAEYRKEAAEKRAEEAAE